MPQPCQVDVELFGDFEASATSDSLEKTINYSQVAALVLETAHAQEYNLLETLAYTLARKLLSSYPVHQVRIRVRKRPMSLVGKLDFVEFETQEP